MALSIEGRGVSDILSYLTKGFLPGLIIASAIYLFGFLSGIIPSNIIGSNGEALGNAVINSTLMTSVSAFGGYHRQFAE